MAVDKHLLIAVAHVALFVPFFLFVGYQRAATPDWAYRVMFALGVIVLAYHSMKAVARITAKSSMAWVNLIHALLVAPLLLWIGYHGKKTERGPYELLLIAGFGALGYHLSNLVIMTNTFVKGGDEDH
jgi:hypothetical protein